ncbi:MAG: ABC transporter substrate-binding protein [Clostridia bacterium]|nr:ABC transporter substrate-binding protein [Clostridia bacterium]
MKLSRIICTLLIFCLLISALPAALAESAPAETSPVTFTDDLGRIITIDSPDRVAALLGSFAQVWLLAGGSVSATADDAWDDLNLPLPEETINLGNTKSMSLELLLASAPDFILASTNTRQNLEWQEPLDAIGIPTAYFDVANFDDYLRLLDICTDITGRKDLFEQYGIAVQKEIEQVIEKSRVRLEISPAPTVLSMRASASSITIKNSEDNVLGEMLRSLGCINIADSDNTLLEKLSLERILQEDPDFIFFVQRGDDEEGMKGYVHQMLMSHPAWSQLTAVKEGRVYFMPKELYNLKPNHRWGEAYAQLEEILANEE